MNTTITSAQEARQELHGMLMEAQAYAALHNIDMVCIADHGTKRTEYRIYSYCSATFLVNTTKSLLVTHASDVLPLLDTPPRTAIGRLLRTMESPARRRRRLLHNLARFIMT